MDYLYHPRFQALVYFLPGGNRRFRHIKCGCLKTEEDDSEVKHIAYGKFLPAAKKRKIRGGSILNAGLARTHLGSLQPSPRPPGRI